MNFFLKIGLGFFFLTYSLFTYATIITPRPMPLSLATINEQADMLNEKLASGSVSLSARTRGYTPVFYVEDFPRYFGGGTGDTLMLDDWNQIDPTETILLPKSVIEIQKIIRKNTHTILQITSKEYPYDSDSHYVDARFVQIYDTVDIVPSRSIKLPSRSQVLGKLESQVGKPYIWGGNSPNGIPAIANFYPTKKSLDTETRAKWTLDGFDCSGILYWATDGYTPRNTSKLISFGSGVNIAGKTIAEIIAIVKPLDIIVWKGHNMIVIGGGQILESTVNFTGTGEYSTPNGVRIRSLESALTEITTTKNRIGINDYTDVVPDGKKKFVIRRWYQK